MFTVGLDFVLLVALEESADDLEEDLLVSAGVCVVCVGVAVTEG